MRLATPKKKTAIKVEPQRSYPAEQYIADVISGAELVGKWARKAVERHVRDLETAAARGLIFDRVAAERAIRFFKFLKHSKGEWAGQRLELAPWQQFILWCIFGWKRQDPAKGIVRRFRLAYVKVARKNGKSTFAAGVGIYLAFADGEPGAEVYTAATKRDQARIVHGEAIAMVKRSPELSRALMVVRDNIHNVASRSKFEPLGADEDTSDGLNVHGAIIDELHAHKNRGMLDVIDSGTGARRQPMILVITTAGAGKLGVDQDMQAYAEKVLDGVIEDDTFFAIYYGVDAEDDWRSGIGTADGGVWKKANPNLGISVSLADLNSKAKKALEMPSALNEFLRKHMNVQTESVTRWLDLDKWVATASPKSDAQLAGRRCFGGIDLSSKLDVTAWVLIFPPETERDSWYVRCRFYVPEATAAERERKARVPYQTWGQGGHLNLTAGNVVDYGAVKADIFTDARQFEIIEIGYDPWNATQIALQLQDDGIKMVEVPQGYRSLSEPAKELEKLLAAGMLRHEGSPVMDWMVSNVSIESDPAGNIKPSKKNSSEKIDGVAALVTALARALLQSGEGSGYDDGVFFT